MVTFSKEETKDLFIAIVVITLLFSYIQSNHTLGSILVLIPISLIAVGLGFILHELGHKIVAQNLGFIAEFRRWDQGLILAVLSGLLFNVIFLAPGAVYVGSYTGMITDEENGKISIAGPIVNLILAVIFYLIYLSVTPMMMGVHGIMIEYAYLIGLVGFSVNSFLAFFNLIPVFVLDGAKVIKWNPIIWLITIAISVIFTYVSYTL